MGPYSALMVYEHTCPFSEEKKDQSRKQVTNLQMDFFFFFFFFFLQISM